MDVSGDGSTNLSDVILIARYILQGRDTINDGILVAGVPGVAEADAAGIKAALAALL